MKTFDGKVAAITGAASGIGRALAVDLTRRGCAVAISDIDEAGLAETVALCEGHGVKVTSARLDVADPEAVYDWAAAAALDHGKVNLVFNNAGVSLDYTFEGMSDEDMHWLMNINFWGVYHGTRAFLPHLRASGDGHIVNVSSVFGLVSVPRQAAYNAAKFGVRGFTDALRMELKIDRSHVSCTTVHPGGVKTNIVGNGRIDPVVLSKAKKDPNEAFQQFARTTAPAAAAAILAAVLRDKRRLVIGWDGKIIDLIGRLPAWVNQAPQVIAGRLANRRG
jgi:NAD(P)-dependent dehydrogenase (short-subunit alcohol dehydrogenase family)